MTPTMVSHGSSGRIARVGRRALARPLLARERFVHEDDRQRIVSIGHAGSRGRPESECPSRQRSPASRPDNRRWARGQVRGIGRPSTRYGVPKSSPPIGSVTAEPAACTPGSAARRSCSAA